VRLWLTSALALRNISPVVIREGPWRSSKTLGINQALSNTYLKSQGLYELRDG